MESKAVNSVLKLFDVSENKLLVGGIPINRWASLNETPFYLYDWTIMEKKIESFRKAMPDDLGLLYAVKANPMPELLKHINSRVDGFDVASGGELAAVLKAGASPGSISFAGPGKNIKEIRKAINSDIGSINVESKRELEIICAEGKKQNKTPRISLRVNPDFELQGSGMKMGGGPKPFGIDSEKIPSILSSIEKLPVDFQGFHIFTGSQNLNAEALCRTLDQILNLCLVLGEKHKENIRLINLGGGFGIPYFSRDETLDIKRVGEFLKEKLPFFKSSFPRARFVMELGRFITGESGIYVTRVLYKKNSRGRSYLVTDGGMNHHLAASGNFGQILRKNYPIILPEKVNDKPLEKINIAGPLCTPLDLIGSQVELPEASEGDLIAILNSGAYGYTASPHLFLGHNPPGQIFHHKPE